MRPKRLKKLLEKCEPKSEEKMDLLCVASLSNFDYIPFALIGISQEQKPFLVTGKLTHKSMFFR